MFKPVQTPEGTQVHVPLFMTGEELFQHTRVGDHAGFGRDFAAQKANDASMKESLYAQKAAGGGNPRQQWKSSHGGPELGPVESVKQHGYEWTPSNKPLTHVFINVEHPMGPSIRDGHHRTASMRKNRPDEFIPITNIDR
jgi:hypothetical protein